MRRINGLVFCLLIGPILLAQGCVSRAIGEGAEKTLGPKGAYWEVRPVAPTKDHRSLAGYSFALGQVSNSIGTNLPPDFISTFTNEFNKRLNASKLPHGGSGKIAVFNVNIIHYEKADMTDNVLGPLEQVVARVELVDQSSNQVLADAVAIGRTGKSVGLGTEWKAWGLSRALIKWAKDYYPKTAGDDKD